MQRFTLHLGTDPGAPRHYVLHHGTPSFAANCVGIVEGAALNVAANNRLVSGRYRFFAYPDRFGFPASLLGARSESAGKDNLMMFDRNVTSVTLALFARAYSVAVRQGGSLQVGAADAFPEYNTSLFARATIPRAGPRQRPCHNARSNPYLRYLHQSKVGKLAA